MALLKHATYLTPFLTSISRNNSTSTRKIVKQVQLLPVIRPCELYPSGKIQLCKWRSGNYSGRYTGAIGSVSEVEVEEGNENIVIGDPNVAKISLENIAQDMIPTHLRLHMINLELCAVLMFDGPPDTEEFIFISNLNSHSIETVDSVNLSYIPEWFDLDKIPYSEMPADDFHWYPQVLDGKKVKGSFVFGGVTELTIKSFFLEEVSKL